MFDRLGIAHNFAERAHIEQAFRHAYQAAIRDAQTPKSPANESGAQYSIEYQNAEINDQVLSLIERVKAGEYSAHDRVSFGVIPTVIADEIFSRIGIDVHGFEVCLDAVQLAHILKDHGEFGKSDHSMKNDNDIAKMELTLNSPDSIVSAGRTTAYWESRNGRNRTAATVLYEKGIGNNRSYYVVEALPITKAKKVYIVSAFIGKEGYKKETPQPTDTQGPSTTSEIATAEVSANSISDSNAKSNPQYSLPNKADNVTAAQAFANGVNGKVQRVVDARRGTETEASLTADETIAASRAGMRGERYVAPSRAGIDTKRLDTIDSAAYNQEGASIGERAKAIENEVRGLQENVNAVAVPIKLKCINQRLKGKRHLETGVEFVERTVAVDGQQLIVIVPNFDNFFEAWLPEDMRYESDSVQFRACNKQLSAKIKKNPDLAENFSKEELWQFDHGITPPRFTWHHDADVGQMQLVLTDIHSKTGHIGGRSIWGGGKEYR